MSENEKDTGAAWKLYMENYGLNFDIDNTVNCSSSNSSSSSSNTTMNPRMNSNGNIGVNPVQIPMSTPFFTGSMGGQGDVSDNNDNHNNNIESERAAEIEFISSLFPMTSMNSPIGTAEHPIGLSYGRNLESLNLPEDFIQHQQDGNGNDSTDEETHVIASMDRLQRLMDSRMENFTRSASTEQNIMSSILEDRFNTTCRLTRPSHEILQRSSSSTISNNSGESSLPADKTQYYQHHQSHLDNVTNSRINPHINPDDCNGSLITVNDDVDDDHDDEDSLDQYLQSYRQQSTTDIHNNRRTSSDTNQNIIINNHNNLNNNNNNNNSGPSNSSSNFNLDDEWRKLSQPRDHNAALTDFLMADVSFTPFSTVDNLYAGNPSGNSYENLNTATTSSSSSSNVPSTQTMRSNLNRLNNGLSRCEEKAENVQQMLEQLQGAIRSSNAISVSNFANRCFELTQRLDATLGPNNNSNNHNHHHDSDLHSSPTGVHLHHSSTLARGAINSNDQNRNNNPLNYELEDAEYAEWDADTTLANGTAYLNFAFEYDDSNHEEDLSTNNANQIQRDSRGMLRHFGSVRLRDMSPSSRDFHLSIGYPINDDDERGGGGNNQNTSSGEGGVQVLSDSHLVMIAENPRSFPRNLIGDDTPVPLYVSSRDNDNSNYEEERSGHDSGVNSEDEVEEDSGIGATGDTSNSMNYQMDKPDNNTTVVENEALSTDENLRDQPNHNTTLESKSSTSLSNLQEQQQQQQNLNLKLDDIENFSDVLWKQGVIPPKIDFSDVESELEVVNKKPLKASSKFSDEDIAQLQKLVKEELEKDCSLSAVEESPRVDEENAVGAGPAGDGNRCNCREEKKHDLDFLGEEEKDESEKQGVQIKLLDEDFEAGDEDEYNVNDHDIEYLVSDKDESEFLSEKGDTQEDDDVESGLKTDSSISISEFQDGEEKDLDAGGDTTSCVLEMSPSKISGFKAGLKSLKLKMCSCFNAKKCRVHERRNSSHNFTVSRDYVERRRSSSSADQ